MTQDTLATLGLAALAATFGAAFGAIYFAALRRSVSRYCAGERGLAFGAHTLARLGTAALVFTLSAKLGALPLAAALLAFLLARAAAVRAASRPA